MTLGDPKIGVTLDNGFHIKTNDKLFMVIKLRRGFVLLKEAAVEQPAKFLLWKFSNEKANICLSPTYSQITVEHPEMVLDDDRGMITTLTLPRIPFLLHLLLMPCGKTGCNCLQPGVFAKVADAIPITDSFFGRLQSRIRS